MDSSWYWYPYTSPGYDKGPFDPELAKMWTPVDLYSGGIEHAILHLLYARFFTKVLRDFGLVDESEPFTRLRNQGMILAEEGTKMSKSRGTQVAPDELAMEYGADALRLHLMFLGPWDQGGPWNSRGIIGMERFIRRAYQLVTEVQQQASFDGVALQTDVDAVVRAMHKTIAKVTEDISGLHFNTMVAALIEFVNELTKRKDGPEAKTPEWKTAVETLVLMMAPSTPYVAEEMWEMLGNPYSVHQQTWPTFDPELTRDEVVEIAVQVNGKVRDKLMISPEASEADAMAAARASEKVQQFAGDATPKRIIYVPGRLLNIIV
ncbi:MAG: class I tRNA ligase family protein [Thermomicrobiales bacterium]